MARVILFVVLALVAACARGESEADLRVSVAQQGGADLAVAYEWRRPQREIVFTAVPGGYRERRWSIATPGFRIERGDKEDRIFREDGAKFSRVDLVARPDLVRLQKEYQPVMAYGEGGALIYTGHFWPLTKAGGRVNAVFDFLPAKGAQAVAFGERAERLADWRSPMAHPAFVYLGPLAPVETPDVMALVDPAAPAWIADAFATIVPESFARLRELVGAPPGGKPNLFLSVDLGRDPGRLSYTGDALPGQFQILLEGMGWAEPTEKAREIFAFSTIHEAVHLWQAAARPNGDEAPEWIHEGAADAIAGEVMLALGRWDAAAYLADIAEAREECAAGLERGSLNGAKSRGDFRALYACGHVIAAAVAQADGSSASAFWKALIARAPASDGYSAALFYDLVAERTGDRDFAERVKDFARTPQADPARAIAALDAAAGSLAYGRGR